MPIDVKPNTYTIYELIHNQCRYAQVRAVDIYPADGHLRREIFSKEVKQVAEGVKTVSVNNWSGKIKDGPQ